MSGFGRLPEVSYLAVSIANLLLKRSDRAAGLLSNILLQLVSHVTCWTQKGLPRCDTRKPLLSIWWS